MHARIQFAQWASVVLTQVSMSRVDGMGIGSQLARTFAVTGGEISAGQRYFRIRQRRTQCRIV